MTVKSTDSTSYTTLISAAALQRSVKHNNVLIFDCRFDLADTEKKRMEYLESHIPGAFYAHLDEQLSSPILADSGRHPMPDIKRLVNWLADCGFDGQQQVVVYDDSFGAMASRLWWLLEGLGHEMVAVLDGGWQAWQAVGGAVNAALPQNKSGSYSAEFDASFEVSTERVLNTFAQTDKSRFQLVDVRANQRFIGAMEPIDPIAGHIPGAINMPLTDNLNEQGYYLPVLQLKELYQPLMNIHSADDLVFMCGSGVTACHSVLAMVHAGYPMPRVYAGSWSEWIRDSKRPIATGQ